MPCLLFIVSVLGRLPEKHTVSQSTPNQLHFKTLNSFSWSSLFLSLAQSLTIYSFLWVWLRRWTAFVLVHIFQAAKRILEGIKKNLNPRLLKDPPQTEGGIRNVSRKDSGLSSVFALWFLPSWGFHQVELKTRLGFWKLVVSTNEKLNHIAY